MLTAFDKEAQYMIRMTLRAFMHAYSDSHWLADVRVISWKSRKPFLESSLGLRMTSHDLSYDLDTAPTIRHTQSLAAWWSCHHAVFTLASQLHGDIITSVQSSCRLQCNSLSSRGQSTSRTAPTTPISAVLYIINVHYTPSPDALFLCSVRCCLCQISVCLCLA